MKNDTCTEILKYMAVTKSGTGTLGLGCRTGMQGCRDAGMRGLRHVGHEHVWGLENMGCRDWRT